MIIFLLLGLFKYLAIMVSAVGMTVSFIRGVEHDEPWPLFGHLVACLMFVALFMWALDL